MERKRLYLVDDIIKLLLHPNIMSSGFVATKVPTMICNSLSFLDHQMIFCPTIWECELKHNGTNKTYRNVAFEDSGVSTITPCSSEGC